MAVLDLKNKQKINDKFLKVIFEKKIKATYLGLNYLHV